LTCSNCGSFSCGISSIASSSSSRRAFGGPSKPLFLQRNLGRFDRFRSKLEPIALDDAFAAQFSGGRKQLLDFSGEDAMKTVVWNRLRPALSPDPSVEVSLPVRLRTTALRYHFGFRDPEADTDIVAFSPAALGAHPGPRLRHLPGPVLRSRGTVHLTSFLPPLGLVAKFAIATEWDPGVLPYIRNAENQCARMIANGRWFERRLGAYDAVSDADGLIPWAARANRARFAGFWGAWS